MSCFILNGVFENKANTDFQNKFIDKIVTLQYNAIESKSYEVSNKNFEKK